MGDLGTAGKLLIFAGACLAAVGGLMLLADRVPGLRLFRLPGDIHIERDGMSIYFPIVSMLVISAIATLVFILFGWLRK